MFVPMETRRTLHTCTVKALLGVFLVFAVIPSFAQHPRITQLIAEKQAKMENLEKCQGTTKNLKIAGISTLGVTAVGVGANIAEAVVLNNAKEDVKKAKENLAKQQEESVDGVAHNADGSCDKLVNGKWSRDLQGEDAKICSGMGTGTWKVKFNGKNYNGISKCATDESSKDPTDISCYAALDKDTSKFAYVYGYTDTCAKDCAHTCVDDFVKESGLRNDLGVDAGS